MAEYKEKDLSVRFFVGWLDLLWQVFWLILQTNKIHFFIIPIIPYLPYIVIGV